MSLLDILIWAILLIFVAKGFWKGLVREVCTLLGLVAGGWAAFRYFSALAEVIQPFIHLPQHVAAALSFLLIFFLIGLLFFLLGHLLTVFSKVMLLGGVNRIGGVMFGLLEGAFVLCMALYFGTTKPMPGKLRVALEHSPAARPFIQTGKEIVTGWESASQKVKPAVKAGK